MVDNVSGVNQVQQQKTNKSKATQAAIAVAGGAVIGQIPAHLIIKSDNPGTEDQFIKKVLMSCEDIAKKKLDDETVERMTERSKSLYPTVLKEFKENIPKIRAQWALLGAAAAGITLLAYKGISSLSHKKSETVQK